MNPGQDILGGEIPEVRWVHGDDECDCTFQRIGEWTNPYIARTLRVRFCCIWAELYKQFPQFVQEIPAYYDQNTGMLINEPAEWDGDTDMPRHLWYRQLAVQIGIPVSEARRLFEKHEPPKGVAGGVKVSSDPSESDAALAELAVLLRSGAVSLQTGGG